MRYILALLLISWRLAAASLGDISGVRIETNGWQCLLYINCGAAATATNGTFDLGLGSDNTITGNQKLAISLSSCGYDDTGATCSVPRVVYGTHRVRLPYPSQAYPDTAVVGDDVVVRVALSDYIYQSDVVSSASIVTNLYKSSDCTNATATFSTVTNSSTATYQRVIGNWTWPGWQQEQGSAMKLRCVAFNRHAQQGRPVRAVYFRATGATSGVISSNVVTQMTIDKTMPDAVPICEYIGTLDISGMTQGENIRCDFTAYPWVGDATSVLDTTDGTNTWPTSAYCSITNLCDTSASYGTTKALVDTTNGADATGVAAVEIYWSTNNNPSPFATIDGALKAVAATNNALRSRNDVGGGIVYVTNGTYAWTGGSSSYGSANPSTFVTITKHPVANRSDVIIGSQSGAKKVCGRVKLNQLTITATSAAGCFSTETAGFFWTDQCELNTTSGTPFYNNRIHYWTHNLFTAMNAGLAPASSVHGEPAIVRGNTIVLFSSADSGGIMPYMVIGNKTTINHGFQLKGDTSVPGYDTPLNEVIAYNLFYGLMQTANSSLPWHRTVVSETYGAALVQNLFEGVTNKDMSLIYIASDSATVTPVNNLLEWNNTCIGQRQNHFYNETGTSALFRDYNSQINFLTDDDNIKNDTFGTADGNRIGNWSALWGVGWSGNFDLCTGYIGGPDQWTNEIYGLSSRQWTGATNLVAYAKFVNRAAADASNGGAGNGDYRITSDSPLRLLQTTWVLPYDIEGVPRGGFDPPGAYASASPRKGAGFFSP